jgi:hypothetical protein
MGDSTSQGRSAPQLAIPVTNPMVIIFGGFLASEL